MSVPLRAALVTPIYAIANLTPGGSSAYQFGVFDLGNPTGSPGSYQFAWTSLGGSSVAPLANLALNPANSEMFLQYNFNQYRTVSTTGAIGASSLGAMDTLFGMAFDNAGGLYGTGYGAWRTLNSSNGSTISSNSVSGDMYSQFGGGLAYASNGDFYFGSSLPSPGALFKITAGGVDTNVGTFSGTSYNAADWMAMFSSGANTYLLNDDRLYEVNLSNASLSLMGTITGLPVDFKNGFSGAVGLASAPIPEPGTWAAMAIFAGGSAYVGWRRRRGQSPDQAA